MKQGCSDHHMKIPQGFSNLILYDDWLACDFGHRRRTFTGQKQVKVTPLSWGKWEAEHLPRSRVQFFANNNIVSRVIVSTQSNMQLRSSLTRTYKGSVPAAKSAVFALSPQYPDFQGFFGSLASIISSYKTAFSS